VHPLWEKADKLSQTVIGAAIEVHRQKGSGLIESIYERCLLRELELRSIPATTQKIVRVEYKGLVFDEPLRFDILVDDCLLIELKAVELLHPSSKAQLFSYMKLLNIPPRPAHQLSRARAQERHQSHALTRSKSNRKRRERNFVLIAEQVFVYFVIFCLKSGCFLEGTGAVSRGENRSGGLE
jgi:GxxExxY protein